MVCQSIHLRNYPKFLISIIKNNKTGKEGKLGLSSILIIILIIIIIVIVINIWGFSPARPSTTCPQCLHLSPQPLDLTLVVSILLLADQL